MRWGEWYAHDAGSIKHVRLGIIVSRADLATPATIASCIATFGPAASARDVVGLLTAANELVWHAFDFSGIGDWVDEDGRQRGSNADNVVTSRQEQHVAG